MAIALFKQALDKNGAVRTDAVIMVQECPLSECISGIVERFIPADTSNRHWREYQEWLSQGNQPLPADED